MLESATGMQACTVITTPAQPGVDFAGLEMRSAKQGLHASETRWAKTDGPESTSRLLVTASAIQSNLQRLAVASIEKSKAEEPRLTFLSAENLSEPPWTTNLKRASQTSAALGVEAVTARPINAKHDCSSLHAANVSWNIADPISIIKLVAVALSTAKATKDFIDDVVDAPNVVNSVARDLESLQGVLS
jgi:hypothetical protein